MLEVGCGSGELAVALAAAGHHVTAIDPEAPEGPPFLRVRLDELAVPGPFDAVVASLSLHHVTDLESGLDRIVALLEAGGLVILREFDRERFFDDPTARWYHGELRSRGAPDAAKPFDEWVAARRARLEEVHPYSRLREALDRRLHERFFARTPYLHAWELDEAAEPRERELIAAGEIQATGFLYVGSPST